MDVTAIRRTDPARHLFLLRLVAAAPLLGIGAMHLTGAAPLEPILEGAGIPFPALNATVAPLFQLLAGGLLLLGFFARLGGLLGGVQMVVALYTHLVFDWADEPPVVLPIAVLGSSLYVLWRGAGALSLDRSSTVEDDLRSPARA